MKKNIFILTLILIFVFFTTEAIAQKKATLYGEIVELTTFVKDGIKPNSPAGKEITTENLNKGGTFVLLEKGTGKIVLLTSSVPEYKLTEQLTPYLGITVFVKGNLYKKGGIRLLDVQDVGKYLK
ncbi:MAG: hypothetical protein IGBAC_0758 [Ignavibacteriae bacterium]|nr:MAG: hypothetical protein IGBAC_0758 [Ignavibacteriota bacterium]